MKWRSSRKTVFIALILLLMAESAAWAELERVRVEGRGFVAGASSGAFRPWGHNYGNAGRLIEDFWGDDWETVKGDFRELRELGANVVRVHLQFAKFMEGMERPNEKSLARLSRLLELADRTGIYLDLTGLGCYRTADTPAWYDALSEPERWRAQGNFWGAIARTCAASAHRNAVFSYDLMNEPISPGQKREAGQWMSGKPFGGYDFVQFISLDPAGRKRQEVAVAWIGALREAIRKEDRETLITVGLLPWSRTWKHLSGFLPEVVGGELDFLSVHIYPEKGRVEEALEGLKQFVTAKPLVIEETFPLTCPASELREFLLASRPFATGWVGHFDGLPPAAYEELRRAGTITAAQALWLEWLELSKEIGPKLRDGE